MPKKRLTDSVAFGEGTAWSGLAAWQAAGLALAAASLAARTGIGAVVGAAILAPVVYALVQLRIHAPEARSTAGLVGSTLGPRAAVFAGVLQVTAYALIAITAAQLFGLVWVPRQVVDDLGSSVFVDHRLWSLWAVAALVVAAVLVIALPDRIIAAIAAVLATGGLLIQLYYGLAVIARALSGAHSQQVLGHGPPTGLTAAGTLSVLAVTIAGFEVATTRTRRGSSGGWPMALAIGAVATIALVLWWACQYSGYSAGSLDADALGLAVIDLYGDTGAVVVGVGTAMFFAAAALALLSGIAAVIGRLDVRVPSDALFAGIVVTMALLAVVVIFSDRSLGRAGGLVLLGLYAAVLAANARIPRDSVVTWWLRLVMPVVLVAVVVLPLMSAHFSPRALTPVVIAAVLIAAAGAAAVIGARGRPG